MKDLLTNKNATSMKTNKFIIVCLMLLLATGTTFAVVKTEKAPTVQPRERKSTTDFFIDEHTAIVMTDPQNDFLSTKGKGWPLFGENITKNGTIQHL